MQRRQSRSRRGVFPWNQLWILLMGLSTLPFIAASSLDCDPCIDRSTYSVTVVVPLNTNGNRGSDITVHTNPSAVPQYLRAPLLQTAADMNVALQWVVIDTDGEVIADQIYEQMQTHLKTAQVLVGTAPTTAWHQAWHRYATEKEAVEDTAALFGWGWGYASSLQNNNTTLPGLATLAKGWTANDAVATGQNIVQALQEHLESLQADDDNQSTTSNNETSTTPNPPADSNTLIQSITLIYDKDGSLPPSVATAWQAVADTLQFNVTINNEAIDLMQLGISTSSSTLPPSCPTAWIVAQPQLAGAVLAWPSSGVCTDTVIVVFMDDTNDHTYTTALYQAITRQDVWLVVDPQVHLQLTRAVLQAALYVTTAKAVALPIESSTYWSGPRLVTAANVPSDTAAACQQANFPVCNGNEEPNDESITSSSYCPCTQRRELRIGGVLHGSTNDRFWDPIFASARQAALDMHIQLDLERFAPPTASEDGTSSSTILYQQMAARIRNLCDSGVDALFVSIPDTETVGAAVTRCYELRVPVVSVNSGRAESAKAARDQGIRHHIGQDEYAGGYGGALRLIEAGMTRGYCVDHAFGNTALIERCQGFQDAIAAHGQGVTFGKHIDVPSDNQEQYVINVEEAVTADGGWDGVGLIGFGADPYPSMERILASHPQVLAGTFDTSDAVYEGVRDGKILFGIDQQPFLQGQIPVYLLSYLVYTQQALTNYVIQSGPSFVEDYPSAEKQVCEANFYKVCPDRPDEDLTLIPDSLIALGYALFALLGVACIYAVSWTYYYRGKWVVRISQPMFLDLVALGCFVSGLSIVFMGFQTSYREDRDKSGDFLDKENPEIGAVDAACMAVPWFYGMGFVITFSALFAKIQRVKLIYQAGLRLERKHVTLMDVAPVMASMFIVESGILIAWQIVAPLQWEREVLDDIDGYATSSVGSCEGGEKGWRFYLGMVLFHVLCLCYALVLCFQTKDIHSDFAESSYVSLAVVFMFQVLVLAVPISALVRDNTDVFYFVRAAAVFLQNISVLVLIFVPKMLRMSEEHRNPTGTTQRVTSMARDNRSSVRNSVQQIRDQVARSVKISEDDLSAIREEGDRISGFSNPSRHSISRHSVRFDSQTEAPNPPTFSKDGRLLSSDELEKDWESLGFPSQENAKLLIELLSRSTDAATRQALLADLFANNTDNPTADGDGCDDGDSDCDDDGSDMSPVIEIEEPASNPSTNPAETIVTQTDEEQPVDTTVANKGGKKRSLSWKAAPALFLVCCLQLLTHPAVASSTTGMSMSPYESVRALDEFGNAKQLEYATKAAQERSSLVLILENPAEQEIWIVSVPQRGRSPHHRTSTPLVHQLSMPSWGTKAPGSTFLVCTGLQGDARWLLHHLRRYTNLLWEHSAQATPPHPVALAQAVSDLMRLFWNHPPNIAIASPYLRSVVEAARQDTAWARPLGLQVAILSCAENEPLRVYQIDPLGNIVEATEAATLSENDDTTRGLRFIAGMGARHAVVRETLARRHAPHKSAETEWLCAALRDALGPDRTVILQRLSANGTLSAETRLQG